MKAVGLFFLRGRKKKEQNADTPSTAKCTCFPFQLVMTSGGKVKDFLHLGSESRERGHDHKPDVHVELLICGTALLFLELRISQVVEKWFQFEVVWWLLQHLSW